MIDLHTHILPGIDDGVKTEEEALEFARTALAARRTRSPSTEGSPSEMLPPIVPANRKGSCSTTPTDRISVSKTNGVGVIA